MKKLVCFVLIFEDVKGKGWGRNQNAVFVGKIVAILAARFTEMIAFQIKCIYFAATAGRTNDLLIINFWIMTR